MEDPNTQTVKLWSFQSHQSVRELQDTGMLLARWDRYSETDPFALAYRWIQSQMLYKKTDHQMHAPVWAWHSCGAFGQAPKIKDARALLSDLELEAGIQTIELECPAELALLSRYSIWNDVLDRFIDDRERAQIDATLEKKLFAVSPETMDAQEAIQAALPYFKADWVIDIRPLPLKSDDVQFDPEQWV